MFGGRVDHLAHLGDLVGRKAAAPGVLVNIDSLFVSGGYRVEKCRYVGSTWGNDWHCHFDAQKY